MSLRQKHESTAKRALRVEDGRVKVVSVAGRANELAGHESVAMVRHEETDPILGDLVTHGHTSGHEIAKTVIPPVGGIANPGEDCTFQIDGSQGPIVSMGLRINAGTPSTTWTDNPGLRCIDRYAIISNGIVIFEVNDYVALMRSLLNLVSDDVRTAMLAYSGGTAAVAGVIMCPLPTPWDPLLYAHQADNVLPWPVHMAAPGSLQVRVTLKPQAFLSAATGTFCTGAGVRLLAYRMILPQDVMARHQNTDFHIYEYHALEPRTTVAKAVASGTATEIDLTQFRGKHVVRLDTQLVTDASIAAYAHLALAVINTKLELTNNGQILVTHDVPSGTSLANVAIFEATHKPIPPNATTTKLIPFDWSGSWTLSRDPEGEVVMPISSDYKITITQSTGAAQAWVLGWERAIFSFTPERILTVTK